MAKIKHIALSTQDVDGTAKFYIDVFGMKEIARIDSPNARGYYLSDGDLNLAILNFKNDTAAGVERGKAFCGIHHFGFQVESHDAIAERLAEAGARR
ncbi:MAG TPA: VOC family protein, partial [Candidatus Bathyarchaeia archaeon]|nr:VOC family protein [Candidatus Bathyarchaeia archaeon]